MDILSQVMGIYYGALQSSNNYNEYVSSLEDGFENMPHANFQETPFSFDVHIFVYGLGLIRFEMNTRKITAIGFRLSIETSYIKSKPKSSLPDSEYIHTAPRKMRADSGMYYAIFKHNAFRVLYRDKLTNYIDISPVCFNILNKPCELGEIETPDKYRGKWEDLG